MSIELGVNLVDIEMSRYRPQALRRGVAFTTTWNTVHPCARRTDAVGI